MNLSHRLKYWTESAFEQHVQDEIWAAHESRRRCHEELLYALQTACRVPDGWAAAIGISKGNTLS